MLNLEKVSPLKISSLLIRVNYGQGILKDTESIEMKPIEKIPVAVKLPPALGNIVDSAVGEVNIPKYPPLIPVPKEKSQKGSYL